MTKVDELAPCHPAVEAWREYKNIANPEYVRKCSPSKREGDYANGE